MEEKFNVEQLLKSLGFEEKDWALTKVFIHFKGYQVDLGEKYVMCRDPFIDEKVDSFWNKVASDFIDFFKEDMDKYELPIPKNFHFTGYRNLPYFDKESTEGWMYLFNELGWKF